MNPLDKLQIIADKYQPGIVIADCEGYYNLGAFPEHLNRQINDYVNAYFDVIGGDVWSIQFRLKRI